VDFLGRIKHQDPALSALRAAHAQGRLAHAYLFWGPDGIGKTVAALGLAQMLLCRETSAPCGRCPECERVARLTHPDLHVLLPEVRSAKQDPRKELEAYGRDPYYCLQIARNASIGIERVRSLKLEASKARVERGGRVIFIRNADRMTLEAAQAALKLIEEPQADTFVVLTCTDPSHLLPTILSRCQRLRLRALPRAFIESILRDVRGASAAQARIVAGLADGRLCHALAWADGDVLAQRDEALALVEAPADSAAEIARRVQRLGRAWDPARADVTVDLLMSWYSDLLAAKVGGGDAVEVHRDRAADLEQQAARLPLEAIKARVQALEGLLRALKQNVNPALALEAALLAIHGLTDAGRPARCGARRL